MLGRQKQSFEAKLRARQFIEKCGLAITNQQVATLVQEFSEVVDRCQRAASHQVYGIRMAEAATQQICAAVRRLRDHHLRPLASIAQAVDDEQVGLSRALRMPRRRLPVTMLLAAAASIREVAGTHTALLQKYGRPDTFLADLGAAIDDVEACVRRRNRAELLQVGATKAIAVHLERAGRLLMVLDTVVVSQFAGDEALLAEWRQAKRVQAKPGPKQGRAEPAEIPAAVAPTPVLVAEEPPVELPPPAMPLFLIAA